MNLSDPFSIGVSSYEFYNLRCERKNYHQTIKRSNPKSQAPNTKQISNSNDQITKYSGNCNFGHWNLFGIRRLKFGIFLKPSLPMSGFEITDDARKDGKEDDNGNDNMNVAFDIGDCTSE